MKQTLQLKNKTKAELTAMARRKKIPVSSGMVKDELIKTIKKGLRKIEAQKKSKATKQTPKKKSAKKAKTKTVSRKSTAGKQTPVKKKTVHKKSPAKRNVKKAAAKKSVAPTSKTVPSSKVETDLPETYGDHRLVVMPRDPNWAYAYWDLNPTKVRDLLKSAGQTADNARWILRVYASPLRATEDMKNFFDVDIHVQGGNYYLNLSRPGARFIVEIGVMDHSGLFRSTAQSNPFILPLDHPSETIAQESTFSENLPSPSVTSFTKPPFSRSQ